MCYVLCTLQATARHHDDLRFPQATATILKTNPAGAYWQNTTPESRALLSSLVTILDSCVYQGLNKQDYHYDEIILGQQHPPMDSAQAHRMEEICTDALLSYCMDLYNGNKELLEITSDELSPKSTVRDLAMIVTGLAKIKNLEDEAQFLKTLEPNDADYLELKTELRKKIQFRDLTSMDKLNVSLNTSRWISHFQNNQKIVVNLPEAELRYFRNDSLILKMPVVAGKPSTPTPILGTWCNRVILYPFWNVPWRIGARDLLPKCKKDPLSPDLAEFQVVDRKGNIFELNEINFQLYNRRNFPYTFRQTTGCSNALGVLKFELTDSLSVYMHDTNFKNAFLSARRYFSHGCIRLQNPLELGNFITGNQIDSSFVTACIHGQEPIPVKTSALVPVFIVYSLAIPSADSVIYLPDVYRRFR